jgi:hypothetical protein
MRRLAALGLLPLSALGGDFVNLGFNEPDLSHLAVNPETGFPTGPVAELVRGWSVSYGNARTTFTGSITLSDGAPPFSLTPAVGDFDLVRYGPYRLKFNTFAGLRPGGVEFGQRPLTFVSQRGLVPVGATSLDFLSSNAFNEVEVTIDGVQQLVGGSPNLQKQVDVRAFAGKEILLEFIIPEKLSVILDVRGFSVVPEPSAWALLGVGALALCWVSRRK